MQSFLLLNFVTSFSLGWKVADVESTKRNLFTKHRVTITILSGNCYFACALNPNISFHKDYAYVKQGINMVSLIYLLGLLFKIKSTLILDHIRRTKCKMIIHRS